MREAEAAAAEVLLVVRWRVEGGPGRMALRDSVARRDLSLVLRATGGEGPARG